jgi:ribonucleoside-diphosphate reductase alpha chain
MQQTLLQNAIAHLNESNIEVIRRDGSKANLNISKIRAVVEWACAGKDVNSIELEAGLTTRLKDGVTTREIQDNLIDCALQMCSPSEPDWRYVAGRLHIWSLWKDTQVSRGYAYSVGSRESGVVGEAVVARFPRHLVRRANSHSHGADSEETSEYKAPPVRESGIVGANGYSPELESEQREDINLLKDDSWATSCYLRAVKYQVEAKRYDRQILDYSDEELIVAGSWLNPNWDLDYDYAGAVLLTKRYLLEKELPQEAFLTCALLLALPEKPEDRLFYAKKFYEAIATRKISLATPILGNLRVPNGSLSSCFILAIDDNLESIFAEITNTARISKNGGGVGVNVSRIRATGSSVMNKPNASGGIIPWIKLLNDTAIAVNQGGRRAGAVTVGVDIWHLDVTEFLEMQTENGDQRRKAYDVFPQLIIPDEFMRRVMARKEWTLVDPYEVRMKLGIELAELWGERFENAYQEIEAEIDKSLHLYKKINARELFKEIMRSQLETGMPYLAFKDTINRANPNQHEGYIPGVNLCVAPETKVFTKNGHYKIKDLEGQYVSVWNGFEWSEVLIKKTGENQPLLRISLSNQEKIDCTYYHHWYIVPDKKNRKIQKVEAKDLKLGDKLIKFNLPIVDGGNDFPYAYTAGFFSGDGTYLQNNPYLYLQAKKQELLPYIQVRNKRKHGFDGIKELNEPAICLQPKHDRIKCILPDDLPAKFTVPLNGYSVDSRLEWLAGLLDADGNVHTSQNGLNSLRISSINLDFLRQVRLMIQTLGVDTNISLSKVAGNHIIKGKVDKCKPLYELNITCYGLYQLSLLGLKTNRLKWIAQKPSKECRQFIRVEHIEITGRVDDTYCFTEHKRHLGMFNGILTGQCCESFSNVKPGVESHTCNLNSLNLANIDPDELSDLCHLAVRILDNTIELTNTPFQASKTHNNKYRTIGVGCMGLADWLAKNRLSYDSLSEISYLFEEIGYWCTYASMELAQQRGAYAAFDGSEWSKGKLIGAKPVEWFLENAQNKERWQTLSENIQTYGIRNSHITAIAPNTSSSLVQGCSASILPVYSKFFYDKWAKGTVPIAPPYINEYFWFYPENKTLDQKKVVKAVAKMQQWIDTGISMELLFNLNQGVYFSKEPDRALKAKDIFDTLVLAWQEGCKAVYYIRTVQKDDFKDTEEGCVACAN